MHSQFFSPVHCVACISVRQHCRSYNHEARTHLILFGSGLSDDDEHPWPQIWWSTQYNSSQPVYGRQPYIFAIWWCPQYTLTELLDPLMFCISGLGHGHFTKGGYFWWARPLAYENASSLAVRIIFSIHIIKISIDCQGSVHDDVHMLSTGGSGLSGIHIQSIKCNSDWASSLHFCGQSHRNWQPVFSLYWDECSSFRAGPRRSNLRRGYWPWYNRR